MKYQKYKKSKAELALRNLYGYYDDNGNFIPWRFVVWSCKYGCSSSKYTKVDGKGIISMIDKDIFEKYVKPWVCATKSQRKELRKVGLDYSKVVKLVMHLAKSKYEIYLWEKYNYDKKFK